MSKKPTSKLYLNLGLTDSHWQALLSYLRSALAAVVAVIATLDWTWNDVAKAFVAALIPPVLRWINPNDHAFGRVK